jgi:hypothetical protein
MPEIRMNLFLKESPMNAQSVVSALLKTTALGTSNSRESELSLNKQASQAVEQVLRHFPGYNVLSAQDGPVEFHVLVPASVINKANATDVLWLNNYYSEHPPVCEGDDLGTTYDSVGSVLLLAVLTGTRSACDLAVITALPFHFVRVVMTQMEVHGLWPSEGIADLERTLRDRRENLKEVESSLRCILDEFWNAFWEPGATDALTTLRERRLFGGRMQSWTDEDAVSFFQ